MNPKRFEDKIVMITGGASGIGLAAAKLFHGEGARLVIVDRDKARLGHAKSELGAQALGLEADISISADIDRVMQQVLESCGRIDVLFANAGISHCPPDAETDSAFFDRIMGINVKGVFFCFVRALPLMSLGATAVFTSSAGAEKGGLGDTLYSASKAAVRSLARSFAADATVQSKKVRVNVVSPGPIKTPLTEPAWSAADVNAYIESIVPLRRWGLPEEVARAVLFLASDDASYMTGSVLSVDGGLAQV
jgi:NAD(P)-dependent dehydrogenase (short-subunit alcohol dehydrogenase family)